MSIFEIDPTELIESLRATGSSLAESVEAAGCSVAEEMELYAKRNAPWTDRTGNARRTIAGFTQWENENVLLIGISGFMEYSPRLEIGFGGRYAILLPTLDTFSPQIFTHIVNAVINLGGQANE